jgi:hypothetical protein
MYLVNIRLAAETVDCTFQPKFVFHFARLQITGDLKHLKRTQFRMETFCANEM